jgi:DNA-binding NarL/FixJ family response regulator
VRLTLEEDPGIEVVGEASSGRDGVELAAETRPDLVLLDLSMPDMDGLEAIPLIRAAAPDARIVVLSGHEAGRISLEALDQGASRYINKAAGLAAITRIVREVAGIELPFTDERFGSVRTLWESFLDGQIDRMLEGAAADATWRPFVARGREFRSRDEMRTFVKELLASGRRLDPRAYGVEPRGDGMVVLGTLEVRGPGGFGATEVFWAFCFSGDIVTLAAGFDRREEALRRIGVDCPG